MTTPTFADVCVGEHVGAFGIITSGTMAATSVFVTPPPAPKPSFVSGTVTSVNGTATAGTCGATGSAGAFVVNGQHGASSTVDVSTTTTFSEHGVSAPTFANVCVGERVGALGIITTGTMAATSVFIIPPPAPKPHAVFGMVASVNGTDTTGTCGTAGDSGVLRADRVSTGPRSPWR